jgi:hypothetical protein
MVELIEAMKKTGEVPVCAVMQDQCEYDIAWPKHWKIHGSDEHLEMSGALNALFKLYPDEPFYGMLDDHTRPLTPKWATTLQEMAGTWKIASGWNLTNRFKNNRMRLNCYCMGGELARALGWVWPDFVIHMYGDDVIEDIGYELGLLEFAEDAVFQSLLLRDGTLKPDENSRRLFKGKPYIPHDRDAYLAWRRDRFEETLARISRD